jgi:hypothetical protein
MARSLCLISLLAASLLASPAAAQFVKIGEVVLAPNERAVGVTADGVTAHVSTYTDGVTYNVDFSVPTSPTVITSFNPAWGDQFNENYYFNGRVVMGNRFGGLNMWDVSTPSAPAQFDTIPTNYHFSGLDAVSLASMELFFYSEHNASGNPGGLRLFNTLGNTFSPVGSFLLGGNLLDGRFVAATNDLWAYQLDGGAGSPRPLMLNVYNCTVPTAPTLAQQFNMGTIVGNWSGGTDLEIHWLDRYLYAACDLDGLRIIDITTRPAPFVANVLSGPNVRVRELDKWLGTTFMVGSVVFGNGQNRFRVLNTTNPVAPILIGNWMGDPNYTIHDLFAHYLPSGLACVLVCGQNAAGQATLQIWA